METTLVLGYEHLKELRPLFDEYIAMLLASDSSFAGYLTLQGYDAEWEHPEEKYGLPQGRLYLLRCDGEAAGCIALRRLDDTRCEMKRLYIRPKYRGQRLGEMLVRQIVADAKALGYRQMLLDTLPFLESAIRLYEREGFCRTECYNNSPMETTIFMKREL